MAKTILVVDDQKEIVDILYKFLSREGFEVLTATDGKDALSLARRAVPDLVILDVMMPGMDGGEVMQHILEDEKIKHVPVIFLTGAISEEEIVIRNDKNTGRLFMSKTGDLKEQVKAIKDFLGV